MYTLCEEVAVATTSKICRCDRNGAAMVAHSNDSNDPHCTMGKFASGAWPNFLAFQQIFNYLENVIITLNCKYQKKVKV